MNWVSAYAIAVNEKTRRAGVVTAPTNGAAGVVPAVLRYYNDFRDPTDKGFERFFPRRHGGRRDVQENASISGAEVGCCAGSAAAMAAAGSCSRLGRQRRKSKTPRKSRSNITCMTRDPIGGWWQIPCIERNAMGAVKSHQRVLPRMLAMVYMVTPDQPSKP